MEELPNAELPQVGQPVVVRDVGVQAYPSRVEKVEADLGADSVGGTVTVTMPAALVMAHPATPGEPFDVTWTLPSGVHVLPVEFVTASVEGDAQAWVLEITDGVWVDQRRRDVRVPATGPVQLTEGPPTPHAIRAARTLPGVGPRAARRFEPLQGELVDVTGTAVQCSVRAAADDARLADGTAVTCRFTFGGDAVQRPGVVRARRPGPTPDETRVVIVFDQPEHRVVARPLARNRA